MKDKASLLELVKQYDRLRTEAAQAAKDQKECGDMIKALLGDKETAPVPGWKVTYKYDKDKEDEVFDADKMQKKAPEEFATYSRLVKKAEEFVEKAAELARKYTKTVKTPGARKLQVVSGEEE